MHLAALAYILAACVLISAGRYQLWTFRRGPHTGGRTKRIAGWALQLLGLLAMVMGVLCW
jgi:hypothetical protein